MGTTTRLAHEDVALPLIVRKRAAATPDRTYLEQTDGTTLTYAAAHTRALLWAAAMRRLGAGRGTVSIVLRRPHVDGVACWLGLGWLGAIEASVNTDYRGDMLRYVIENSGTRLVVVASEFLPRLVDITGSLPPDLVVVVPDVDEVDSQPFTTVARQALFDGITPEPPTYSPRKRDIASIIYTSGTTGPSKGVLVPWAQLYATAVGVFVPEELSEDDAYYSPAATYHISGKLPALWVATCGGRVVMREHMSLTEYWDDIIRTRCTMAAISSVVTDPLLDRPPAPADRDLPLRLAIGGPVPPRFAEFEERYGVRFRTGFTMTEISMPIHSADRVEDYRSCGRLREGWPFYDVRIVDADDDEVAPGEVGELVVRTAEPWTLNAGYLGYPDKTAEAWRNGWFHTGDAFRVDEQGRYFYVDRFKDAIRRRGENISSYEVEVGVSQHPDVAECAAIAVPSATSGDEIKVCVVLVPGSALAPDELVAWLAPRMPRFMVPRYVEVLDALPKTEATLKVQKVELRENPLNERTWDREAAGIAIAR